MKRLVPFCLILSLLTPSIAQASPNTPTTVAIMFSVNYAVPALGISATVGGLTTNTYNTQSNPETVAVRYFKQNSIAIAQDISLGGGHALNEFGALVGLDASHNKDFTRLIRTDRRALLVLLAQATAHELCVAHLLSLANKARSISPNT